MFQATLPPQSGAAPRTTTRPARIPRAAYFSRHHPLAQVARHRCRTVHPRTAPTARLANIACGACWEHAIRTDERIAVEHGLDSEPDVPADYLDEVAVRRAMTGRPVALTPAERREAVRLLHARHVEPVEIARLLHTTERTVRSLLALIAAQPDTGPAEVREVTT